MFKNFCISILTFYLFNNVETLKKISGLSTTIPIGYGRFIENTTDAEQIYDNEIHTFFWKKNAVQNNIFYYQELYPIYFAHMFYTLKACEINNINENVFLANFIKFYCIAFYYKEYEKRIVYESEDISSILFDYQLQYEFDVVARFLMLINLRIDFRKKILSFFSIFGKMNDENYAIELDKISYNSLFKLSITLDVCYAYLECIANLIDHRSMLLHFLFFDVNPSLAITENIQTGEIKCNDERINTSVIFKYSLDIEIALIPMFLIDKNFFTSYHTKFDKFYDDYSANCKNIEIFQSKIPYLLDLFSRIIEFLHSKYSSVNFNRLKNLLELAHIIVFYNYIDTFCVSDAALYSYFDLLLQYYDEIEFNFDDKIILTIKNFKLISKIHRIGGIYNLYNNNIQYKYANEILSNSEKFDVFHSLFLDTQVPSFIGPLVINAKIRKFEFIIQFPLLQLNYTKLHELKLPEEILHDPYFIIYYAIIESRNKEFKSSSDIFKQEFNKIKMRYGKTIEQIFA
ncbi:hypothetical protein COBT_000283 [Conglomerata obtusa]